jgi:hypothetical protein
VGEGLSRDSQPKSGNVSLFVNNAALFALNLALLKNTPGVLKITPKVFPISPEVNLMEDMWKRKLSLPSSEWPVNTGNTSIFVEDGRDFTTFFFIPADRHSAPCCRLDTSLLSAGQQGAERRSDRKVTIFYLCR